MPNILNNLDESKPNFFSHSFGFDCSRRGNLQILDDKTLVFVSGNLIHFLDSDSGTITFQRSSRGTGISCIAVSPEKNTQ